MKSNSLTVTLLAISDRLYVYFTLAGLYFRQAKRGEWGVTKESLDEYVCSSKHRRREMERLDALYLEHIDAPAGNYLPAGRWLSEQQTTLTASGRREWLRGQEDALK